MHDLPITNEQEAAVAILFACVMGNGRGLNQSQIEQLSRMLVLSSKFSGSSLNDLTIKALSLQAAHGSKIMIEQSAPLVSEDFRESVFAMCCEIMTSEGRIADRERSIWSTYLVPGPGAHGGSRDEEDDGGRRRARRTG